MNTQAIQKFLINCENGVDNLERATISFILAVTASKTAETAMFVTSDASALMTKDGTKGLQAPGYEPIGGLMQTFIENGGKIWLCPACAKAKNILEADLVDGVEIAGAPKTMEFIESGAKLLA